MHIQSETKYPLDGAVSLTITPKGKGRFPLYLRVPAWATGFTATIAGKKFQGTRGQYLKIERSWRAGDRVQIGMDLTVQILPGGKSYPDAVAYQRGPQVLALDRSVNPGTSLDDAQPKGSALTVADPAKQVYSVEGATGRPLLLIPFADAAEMRVWLRKP